MKKILIVEDNNDCREILGLFLTMIGHQAIKAKNSNEAIAFAEAEGPDLIFMDIELPDVQSLFLGLKVENKDCTTVATVLSRNTFWRIF